MFFRKLSTEEEARFPVEVLVQYKASHEARIRLVTGLGPDMRTEIVQLKAQVATAYREALGRRERCHPIFTSPTVRVSPGAHRSVEPAARSSRRPTARARSNSRRGFTRSNG